MGEKTRFTHTWKAGAYRKKGTMRHAPPSLLALTSLSSSSMTRDTRNYLKSSFEDTTRPSYIHLPIWGNHRLWITGCFFFCKYFLGAPCPRRGRCLSGKPNTLYTYNEFEFCVRYMDLFEWRASARKRVEMSSISYRNIFHQRRVLR